ncbi:hypothetical protein OGATHE_002629 [Ogataea polymorpha]|uniref:Uncharacterized protein n=1 Tax=Ogataea polymorpha TaxID=460523 RepID=A0A9P8PDF0_9ASCO|nr:hypothetical protein OGATHE_002629 [Ogataea polymorpha]
MFWKEVLQVLCNTNRSNTWTTPTMRYSESLMQIQMTDVGSQVSRGCQSHLSIHVRAIKINLASMSMNEPDSIPDCRLEHTICRWVCDHNSSKIGSVLGGFSFEILYIKISVA